MTKYFYFLAHLILVTLLSTFLLKTNTLASPLQQHSTIPITSNLQQENKLKQKHLPLLLMFSIQNCPYCAIVREEFLEPMKISGDYENKVVMRLIDMSAHSLIDFDGRQIKTNDLVLRYKVTLAPTIIIVDSNGKLLTEPLIGISTRDYYGGYLDQAIDDALKKTN